MTRFIIFAVFIHTIILSFVWVGFAVPLPRNQGEFFYSGSLPAEDLSAKTVSDKKALIEPAMLKDTESGFFSPWVLMRDLNKPKN